MTVMRKEFEGISRLCMRYNLLENITNLGFGEGESPVVITLGKMHLIAAPMASFDRVRTHLQSQGGQKGFAWRRLRSRPKLTTLRLNHKVPYTTRGASMENALYPVNFVSIYQ